jgi:hypothetical protein
MPLFLKVGSKTLSISFRSVKVICSLSFLPFGLDKFAKTFDLIEGKKGFFHIFSTQEKINITLEIFRHLIIIMSIFFALKKK